MVELLAAGLTGANYAAEASSFLDAEGPPSGTGQLIIAFDPDAFAGGIAHFVRLTPPAGCAPARRPRQGATVAGDRSAVTDTSRNPRPA
jgi:(2R)-3-sulfolactate dehydrogenase (NADP+)